MICKPTSSTNAARKSAVPAKYPQLRVIVTVSPPVSPSVVAAILMIQKAKVTSGTLLDDSSISLSHSIPQGTFACLIFLRCLNVQFAANVLWHPGVTQNCDRAVGAGLGYSRMHRK